ncbi:MAG: sugar phosphate nucleotidyltransferase [Vulcanimicrobiaceae bacterium]
MKAMILAGGLSTRLYPLTKQVPKPLVPVAGEPNAAHLLRYLADAGFDEVAINVHYLAERIVTALGDGARFGVKLRYLHEPELMGSAGALKALEQFFSGETFVVVGCDDLTDLSLAALLDFHRRREAIATIGLVERECVEQYGVVLTDPAGKVVGFQEKPARGTERSRLVNTGIYAFEPEIFAWIPPQTFYDFGAQVFPALQQAVAAFYGYDARGAYWCDIGTPSEYRRASHDLLSGGFSIPGVQATGIDASARIASDVQIEGPVWIGPGVQVGQGVRIVGPSVFGAGACVGDGAHVEHSILWDGARVGSGAQVREVILGMNYAVADESVVEGLVLAHECEPDAAAIP